MYLNNGRIVSPDCWEGKHRICDGSGWSIELDQSAPCQCDCHADELGH